jgi:hypothetical protein
MKNWRDLEDYSFTDDLPPWRWAWEFLRRNPEYQADFQDAIRRFNAREGEYAAEAEILDAIGDFIPTDGWVKSVPSMQVHEKWLLWFYLNPELDVPDNSPFVEFGNLYLWEEGRRPLQDYEVLVRFDLRFPIKPQWAFARERLGRRKRTKSTRGDFRQRVPRNQPKKWQLYLRLLDARAANASYVEIAAVLFGIDDRSQKDPVRKVDGPLRQARRMSRAGYREILLLPKG